MTTPLHGGFDQVFEISADHVAGQARSRLALGPTAVAVDTAEQKIDGVILPQVRGIWLAAAREELDPATGDWRAVLAPAFEEAELVVGIDLASPAAGLVVERITFTDANGPHLLAIPANRRRLDLHAGVLVYLPVVAEALHVRADAGAPFPDATVPCVALATGRWDPAHAGHRGSYFDIVLDEGRLRASPFVTYLLGLATAFGLDAEATVMAPLRGELRRRIAEVVAQTLAGTTDRQVEEPGHLLLYAGGSDVRGADVLVTPASLRVLLTLGGPGGQSALITRSTLGPGDAIGVCVNGISLLRDQIRDVIRSLFTGLEPDDFVAGEPCTIDSRELVTLAGDSNEVVLVYLQVGIGEDEDLVLWFQIELEALATTVLVEVEVPITLTVERVLAQGGQALSITPRIGAGTVASLARTGVPGWGHIVQALVNGKISGALAAVEAPQPFTQVLPSGTELRVKSFSMHQDDAPRGTRSEPDIRLIGQGWWPELGDATLVVTTEDAPPPTPTPARWRDHDLVVSLASREYPAAMTVRCVVPDSEDPGGRIDGLGGIYRRGNREVPWAMATDTAIDYVRGGGTLWVAPETNDAAVVVVVDAEPPYLRTTADSTGTNNLSSLPTCPPSVDSPVADLDGDSTTTVLSPTMVHWRDVIPIGDKGDEVVNQGEKVAATCRVVSAVLELVDRQGNVVASARPGVDATVPGAGARLLDDPIGGRSLAVRVHWWFDAYNACRYRVRYVIRGTGC